MDVSYSTIVDCINEQFIVCGCSLSVACSVGSGYICHIGLDTMESYLILRAVVLAYIYGLGRCLDFSCCSTVGGCIPWWRYILWLRRLATTTFWSPVSNLVTFGAMEILCGAVCSATWVLLCAIGAVLGRCRWCVTITIATDVGWLMLVMADCIHRFGAVGDLFSGMLNGKVVHCNVS